MSSGALKAGSLTAGPLEWGREGAEWPNAAWSRHVEAGQLSWHVQVMGKGPVVLLLHGTGASTHSWRDLAPVLSAHFTLVIPDLPGHAFTSQPKSNGLTLPAMAQATGALLEKLGLAPAVAIGHSAGAAIALAMIRDGHMKPNGVVGLNAALLPFGGVAGLVFRPMAQLLTFNPLVANILAGQANPRRVETTITGTGSTLDEAGFAFYRRLFATPRHVQSALQMMANWDLVPLVRAFPNLTTPVALIVAGGDLAVPPDQGRQVAEKLPNARVVYLKNLGHLAHEEAPADVAAKLLEIISPWTQRPPATP